MSNESDKPNVIKVIQYDDTLTEKRSKEETVGDLTTIFVQEASPRVRAERREGHKPHPVSVKIIAYDDSVEKKTTTNGHIDGLPLLMVQEASAAVREARKHGNQVPASGSSQKVIKIVVYDDSVSEKEVKERKLAGISIVEVKEASPAVRAARQKSPG